jgi:RNA polymerase sigma factor (TIGR02999 family)
LDTRGEVTALLNRITGGDAQAEEQLIELLYDDLKAIATRYMRRERQGHSLQTTALVNEAYLKLTKSKSQNWQDRVHFLAVAAQVMRRVLVDHARNRGAEKRGGAIARIPLDESLVFSEDQLAQLIEIDLALARLQKREPRACRVVELRFFGGLTVEETAEVLRMSPRTVKREWNFGRAWLRSELGGMGSDANAAVAQG